MSKFTFEGKLIDAISQMIFEDTVGAPDFNRFHTVYPGIVTNTEVGFIGEGSLVGVPDTGCNSQKQTWSINTRKLEWSPKTWEIYLQQCYTDLQNAATIYSLHTGVRIPDFTDTDYMNIVLEVLRKSVRDFMWRSTWFGDTAAASATTGAVTAGVDVKYFNLLDGFWKQAITQATSNTEQRVTISENAGESYAAQELGEDFDAFKILRGLVFGAPIGLRGREDGVILTTQNFYDAYNMQLTNGVPNYTSRDIMDGVGSELRFNDIPVIAMPQWDKTIRAYFDNGTKYDNPTRAIYTSRAVLGVGVDSYDSFDNTEVWYNKEDKVVNMRMMGRLDAKLTNPDLFMIAI